jgi:hypothetical protein
MPFTKQSHFLISYFMQNNCFERKPLNKKTLKIFDTLYDELNNANKYISELKNKWGENFYRIQIKQISTVSEIIKPKTFNINSFPEEIRTHIDIHILTNLTYHFSLFERNIKIHFLLEDLNAEIQIDVYNEYVDRILIWLYINIMDSNSQAAISSSEIIEDGPQLEAIDQNSTTSTIVLCILAHGKDLNDMLDSYNGKLNNTLVFSVANKSCVALGFRNYSNFDKMSDLFSELNTNKKKIFDVITDLEKKTSSTSDNPKYNFKTSYKKTQTPLHIMEEIQDNITKNQTILATPGISKFDRKRAELALEHWIKIKNDTESKVAQNNIDSEKCMIACEKGLTNKPRFIKNNRLYDSTDDETLDGANFGFHVLDIRNPKNARQNNYIEIQDKLNENTVIRLSEILKICYQDYDFDYVTIFDFACRTLDSETCSNVCRQELCVDCSTSSLEIQEGIQVIDKYKEKNIGGMKRKRKRKTKKVRKTRTKKSRKTKAKKLKIKFK